ncbi:oxidoreductase [Lichenihabitans sp. Uapishka_5]|uniref:acrylyl-CoA reductase (NADPH) n=1 Tax=Lichenihabitans sp. Uapishka_5 TaxID=3037302 RepID=UPI0029E81D4E|nr:MDR family oxidoreductase [Lichenihabitans sp. Uapishka_5]MDX7949936.1 oxidoreductase [Lichenihabitans sp. Uapishka_5]
MASFKALVIDAPGTPPRLAIRELNRAAMMPGDTLVRLTHSTVNYKDGLAITGRGPVVRQFPMVPGIDFSGIVEATEDPRLKPGDAVVLNGWGVGETHWGAYAELAQVPGEWLIPLPVAFTPAQAMAIGTAGYTAMLAVMALERHGLVPSQGPMLVTGAAGGVGSMAVALLAALGWSVTASTGRAAEADYLRRLGATAVIDRAALAEPGKPLGTERWAGGIDCVGGQTLVTLLSQIRAEGAVAACGLAGGMDLPGTAAPFILRGVSLLGINSVFVPRAARIAAWDRLARDLDPDKLATMTTTVGFDDIVATAQRIVDGGVRGRVVVALT